MNYQPTTKKRFSKTVPLEECFTESPTAAAWALFFGTDLHIRLLVGVIEVPLFHAKPTHDAHVKLLHVRVVAHPNTPRLCRIPSTDANSRASHHGPNGLWADGFGRLACAERTAENRRIMFLLDVSP